MSGDINNNSKFVSDVLADVIIFAYEVRFVFWNYIFVDEVSWITLKNYYKVRWNYYKLRQVRLLQSAMDSYSKWGQLFYYKVWHGLLQIATDITKCDKFITNFDRYYKLSAMIITNCDSTECFWILFLLEDVGCNRVSHCQKEKQCAVANCQILCMVI